MPPVDGDSSNKDKVHAATIRHLMLIPGLYERSQGVRLGLRRTGSRESRDREHELGYLPGVIAVMKLAGAADHLLALYNATHRDDAPWLLPTWAHYSLLRGAIEASADVRWLVDRDQTSAVRIGRGIDRMLYALEERAAAETALQRKGRPFPPEFSTALMRMDELKAKAPKVKVKGSGHPGTTNLVRSLGTCGDGLDEYHFRFLSGILHGVPWATIYGAEKMGDLDDDVSVARSVADPLMTWHVTRCGIRHFLAATASCEGYIGI
jgi:hypothetical protein